MWVVRLPVVGMSDDDIGPVAFVAMWVVRVPVVGMSEATLDLWVPVVGMVVAAVPSPCIASHEFNGTLSIYIEHRPI